MYLAACCRGRHLCCGCCSQRQIAFRFWPPHLVTCYLCGIVWPCHGIANEQIRFANICQLVLTSTISGRWHSFSSQHELPSPSDAAPTAAALPGGSVQHRLQGASTGQQPGGTPAAAGAAVLTDKAHHAVHPSQLGQSAKSGAAAATAPVATATAAAAGAPLAAGLQAGRRRVNWRLNHGIEWTPELAADAHQFWREQGVMRASQLKRLARYLMSAMHAGVFGSRDMASMPSCMCRMIHSSLFGGCQVSGAGHVMSWQGCGPADRPADASALNFATETLHIRAPHAGGRSCRRCSATCRSWRSAWRAGGRQWPASAARKPMRCGWCCRSAPSSTRWNPAGCLRWPCGASRQLHSHGTSSMDQPGEQILQYLLHCFQATCQSADSGMPQYSACCVPVSCHYCIWSCPPHAG